MLPTSMSPVLSSQSFLEGTMAAITKRLEGLSISGSQDPGLATSLSAISLQVQMLVSELLDVFSTPYIGPQNLDSTKKEVARIAEKAREAFQVTSLEIQRQKAPGSLNVTKEAAEFTTSVQNQAKHLIAATKQANYLIGNAQTLSGKQRVLRVPPMTLDFLKATAYGLEFFTGSSPLGQGGFSDVYSIRVREQESTYAMKTPKVLADAKKTKRNISQNKAENLVLLTISHPNIVRTELVGLDLSQPLSRPSFLVMEKADATLSSYLKENTLTEKQLAKIICDITSALSYLHNETQITFCDIKPENILLFIGRDGEITAKLSDFGLAKLGFEKIGFRGTTQYASPEMASNAVPEVLRAKFAKTEEREKHFAQITGASDIWSFGVLIYDLLGQPLPCISDSVFRSEILNTLKAARLRPDVDKTFRDAYAAPLQKSSDPHLEELDPKRVLRDYLLPLIFQNDPSKRPTAPEIHELFAPIALES